MTTAAYGTPHKPSILELEGKLKLVLKHDPWALEYPYIKIQPPYEKFVGPFIAEVTVIEDSDTDPEDDLITLKIRKGRLLTPEEGVRFLAGKLLWHE